MNNNTVTIFLTPIDADKYKMFLEHYEFFNLLIDNDIHKIKNGSVELNFNEHGVLGSIIKHQMTYRRIKL